MEGLIRNFLKQTVVYTAAQFAPMAFNFVGAIVYTRIFTAQGYGAYFMTVSAAGLISALLVPWLQQVIVRFSPTFVHNGHLRALLTIIVLMLLLMVLGVGLLGIVLYPWIAHISVLSSRFYLAGLGYILSGLLFETLIYIFPALLNSKGYAKYRAALPLLQLAISLLLIYLVSADSLWLLIGACAGYVILCIPMSKELRILSLWSNPRPAIDLALLKRCAVYGLPLIGWSSALQILNGSDRLVIGAYRGLAEVGIYSSAYSLATGLIGLISFGFYLAAQPLIMDAWERQTRGDVQHFVTSLTRVFLVLTGPLVVYIAVVRVDLLSTLFGPSFQQGYTILPPVAAAYVALNLGLFGQTSLQLHEQTLVQTGLLFVCAVSNVLLNLLIVPHYGYVAAAVTAFLTFLLYPVLIYCASKRYLAWCLPSWQSLGRIAVALVILAVCLTGLGHLLQTYPGPIRLVISAAASVPIYGSALLLTGEIKETERQYVIRFLAKSQRKLTQWLCCTISRVGRT